LNQKQKRAPNPKNKNVHWVYLYIVKIPVTGLESRCYGYDHMDRAAIRGEGERIPHPFHRERGCGYLPSPAMAMIRWP